jgi:hypothetical protein
MISYVEIIHNTDEYKAYHFPFLYSSTHTPHEQGAGPIITARPVYWALREILLYGFYYSLHFASLNSLHPLPFPSLPLHC